MDFITRRFDAQYYNLNSAADAEELEAKLRLFCGRSFWDFSENLSGRIKNDGYYSFSRRWEWGAMTVNGISVYWPKMKVKITPQDNGALIEAKLSSAPFALAMAVLVALIGTIVMVVCFTDIPNDWPGLICGLILIGYMPVGIAYLVKRSRNRLLDTFVDVFNLRRQ